MTLPLNRVAQWVELPSAAAAIVRPTLVLVGSDWYADFAGTPGDGIVVTSDAVNDSFAIPDSDVPTAGYTAARIAPLASDLVSY